MNHKSSFGMDLVGKVAVITGASRGIGRAIATHLAARGCGILGTCVTPEGIAKIQSVEIPTGVEAKMVGIQSDIYDTTCPGAITLALRDHFDGKVDIFINNAADPYPGVIGELSIEEITRSLTANIQTPVLIMEEFVKHKMFRPNGRIIYISSIRSRQPWADQLMYSAGKSAGESLCRTWADAFGGKDERVRRYHG
jgi:3-oxoacyl-[acyl-carrier protein] reductase